MLTLDTVIRGYKADRTVTVNGAPLSPAVSQRAFNHSPDGFNWGYSGSGPAQLALSLLLLAIPDTCMAIRLHQGFKRDVIAGLPDTDFELKGSTIIDWLAKQAIVSVNEVHMS